MPILYKGAPKMTSQQVKCLQMSLNVSKCLQNVSKMSLKRLQNVTKCLKMSPNVSFETFSHYRLHQSEIPNALPGS